jgi:hypothetical protein
MDDALLKRGSALTFQLVLVRGRVSIGPDCHWCRSWKKHDAMVMGAWRRHALELRKDCGKHIEEGWQEIIAGACLKCWAGWADLATPAHLVITVPKGHGEGAEVLEDGSQRREPLCSQDHIVANEGQGEEVSGERLTINGERRIVVHT